MEKQFGWKAQTKETKEFWRKKMIDRSHYLYDEKGRFSYITDKMIQESHSAEEHKNFCQWISGQTVGVTADGVSAIYTWDYERWLRQGRKTKQRLSDWD
jgi:hypothetical protein